MRPKVAPADALIASIAASQHGVVASRQLRDAGLSTGAVSRRVRLGRLYRLHQGVYAVGHSGISQEGRWMAAVLACGRGAVVSHRSAASLWDLLPPPQGPVDISVPTHSGRHGRDGIRLHRRRALAGEPGADRRGIPVTDLGRTIADLRPVVPAWQWRRAVRQAEMRGLQTGIQSDRSRSDLERDFLALCRRHRIPAPEVNVKVGRWTVDFFWRRQRVAVETDFYGYHRTRVAFRDDRARDLELRRCGIAVHRFSEEQVNERPVEVAADLRQALGLAS